jgi:FkbM family methyltransferase
MKLLASTIAGRSKREFASAVRNLGIPQFLFYGEQVFRSKLLSTNKRYTLFSKHLVHPVQVRPSTSDLSVFNQIFLHREYRCLDDLEDPRLVVDCGANVGYSAAYFLSKFPNAFVIAVEPDPGNFTELNRNLAPYETRYTALHSAIWSHATKMVLREGYMGAGREWARQVREATDVEENALVALDIPSILALSKFDRISILKVDIEGAETELFAGSTDWLTKVDNLVIELHGDECEATVYKAMSKHEFAVSRSDELHVFRRLNG